MRESGSEQWWQRSSDACSVWQSRWAQEQDTEITTEEAELQDAKYGTIGDQSHLALLHQCKGDAAPYVRNVEEGNGLEAWRKLVTHFEPKTKGHSRRQM